MANSNYLNPSLFSLGVDNLENSYIGWILVGKNSIFAAEDSVTALDSSNFPYSDGNIAGLMSPTKVKPSSADGDTGAFTKGTIGYYIDSNSAGKEDIILKSETDTTSTEDTKGKKSFNIGVEDTYSGGITKLFVNIDSTSSTILPPNVGSDRKDTNYIDISNGTGKLLLVKYTDNVNDGNISNFLNSETESTPLKDLRNEYESTSNTFDVENNTIWVDKYIDKVLFVYDVNPSNGDHCNDWNYTGFSVGKIEVTLSGLNS